MSLSKGKRRRLTVRMPAPLVKRLEMVSRASGDSVNDLICHYVDEATQSKTSAQFKQVDQKRS